MRHFNTEGVCRPEEHYMVRFDDRLTQIKTDLVDKRKYFVVNRGRQYGKTTTLNALERYLKEEYIVLALDFQLMGTENFVDEAAFVRVFAGAVLEGLALAGADSRGDLRKTLEELTDKAAGSSLNELFVRLSVMCRIAPKPMVLMIDEIDSASNHQVFLDFLAQIRGYYLKRDKVPAFHSVILAGVYDIKNLKLKLRPEKEHQYNSPWNIAAKFKVDMSFSAAQIADMLREYEVDHHTGMDIGAVAEEIYAYTSGYPVLVSAVCKCISEELPWEEGQKDVAALWSKRSVEQAVVILLKENMPLFESMAKQLDFYPELHSMIEDIVKEFVIGGKTIVEAVV